MKDLLARLESLRESRAKAKAEHQVATESLEKALHGLKTLGIDSDADLTALRQDVDQKMTSFEAQIKAAEDELQGLTGD